MTNSLSQENDELVFMYETCSTNLYPIQCDSTTDDEDNAISDDSKNMTAMNMNYLSDSFSEQIPCLAKTVSSEAKTVSKEEYMLTGAKPIKTRHLTEDSGYTGYSPPLSPSGTREYVNMDF